MLAYDVIAKTIVANGGHTWDVHGDVPTFGYAVSSPCCQVILEADGFDGTDVEAYVTEYAQRVIDADGALWFGAWAATDGRVYLDLTLIVPTRTEALLFGQLGDQVAVWDIAREREITVPPLAPGVRLTK